MPTRILEVIPDGIMDTMAERGDKYPLPQNAAKAAQVRAVYREQYRATTVGAFEKSGQASAPWAPLARKAMELRSEELSLRTLTGLTDHAAEDESDEAVRAALEAGCDDPLIRYWKYTLDVVLERVSERKTLAEHRAVVQALVDSRYPHVRKLHAVSNLLAALDAAGRNNPFRGEVPDWERQYWSLFESVAARRDPVAEAEVILASRNYLIGRTDGRGYMASHKEVARHLRDAPASAYVQLVVRGDYYTTHAWQARGSGWADTVTEEGWELFGERLAEARAALEEAYDTDPSGWQAHNEMIVVCMGQSLDRGEMEKWFARAMTANPDNALACECKLNYLNEKWHGTSEEFLGFGWKIARSGNTTGHLPFAAVRHHNHHSRIMGERYRKSEHHARTWYGNPAHWTTILRALEAQLAAKPKDRYYRSLLARIACIGGHYDVARAQFEILGDGFHPSAFDDRAECEKFRAEARNATPAAGK